MSDSKVISLSEAYGKLRFVGDRRPDSSDAELAGAFAELSAYRDGALFIGHYAGNSEWERHGQGDELVYVLEGETTLVLLEETVEQRNLLQAGQMLVVPRGTWHRFESPDGVKIFTATPQPTDHSVDYPPG